LPNFIVEFDPQKKHFLHHINNKCSKGKYLSAFPKISPLKMTNKPEVGIIQKASEDSEESSLFVHPQGLEPWTH
ncbi:MAG: hypothetical protein IJ659_07060, partial [Alloprevotella sp.]|nr:hypothetical protein [Alloprevotella sp.]